MSARPCQPAQPHACPIATRRELAGKYGIGQIAFAPFEDGVVEFGTTKSHKKLLGKKRKRVEPEGGAAAAALAAVAAGAPEKGDKKKKKKPAQAVSTALPAPPPVVASKGRWESTMAARLLGGG